MVGQNMTERFEMRLSAAVLQEVDSWRGRQSDMPSRAEAIRRLIEAGLSVTAGEDDATVRLSAGDKIIMMMVGDLARHLKVRDAEVDPDFITEVVTGGHSWALRWRYSGALQTPEVPKLVVDQVVDVLDMWTLLEASHSRLSRQDKQRVHEKAPDFGSPLQFPGFDGNDEADHMAVAQFLIEQLKRFTNFEGREMNSHRETISGYMRMLGAFEPLRKNLKGRLLNADELAGVLEEWTLPGKRSGGLRIRRAK
jgi:uncharacterized protein YfbU (UPF0304 family)